MMQWVFWGPGVECYGLYLDVLSKSHVLTSEAFGKWPDHGDMILLVSGFGHWWAYSWKWYWKVEPVGAGGWLGGWPGRVCITLPHSSLHILCRPWVALLPSNEESDLDTWCALLFLISLRTDTITMVTTLPVPMPHSIYFLAIFKCTTFECWRKSIEK